jgi:hypothetical protein
MAYNTAMDVCRTFKGVFRAHLSDFIKSACKIKRPIRYKMALTKRQQKGLLSVVPRDSPRSKSDILAASSSN